MSKIDKNSIPQEVLQVAQTLTDNGFEAYLVGGCVRDLLLGKTPKDWDITTNAKPEQIQSVFPEDKTFYENNFGTVGVKTESDDPSLAVIEVTPFRIEGKYSDKRRPDRVVFSDSLFDDLSRRDFTINALAYNLNTEELIDEYEGVEDLQKGVIRTVGDPNDRFSEDALRMLRAVRFVATLNFAIEGETLSAIARSSDLLQEISKERIRDEFLRIISSPHPLSSLAVAQKLGLLKFIIPELEKGIGCMQGGAHKFDVFEHNLRALQHAADKNYPLHVRLAALFHDIAKPHTRRKGIKKEYTFFGHEVVGARITEKIMKEDLKMPSELTEKVVKLVRWHMFFADPDKITLSAVRRMIARVGEDLIWDLLNLRICDRIGTGRPKEQPFRFRKYKSMVEQAMRDPISVSQLKIDGKQVMEITKEKPSPRIGWILHALLDEVLDDPNKNTFDYLEKRAKELASLSDDELAEFGKAGKKRLKEEEEKEIKALRKKYHVA